MALYYHTCNTQVTGSKSSIIVSGGEPSRAVLCPVLGTILQNRQRQIGKGPEEYNNNERSRKHDIQGKVGKMGLFSPGKMQGLFDYSFQAHKTLFKRGKDNYASKGVRINCNVLKKQKRKIMVEH